MHCDSFVLSIRTNNLVGDLNELPVEEDLFVFIKIVKDHPFHCKASINVVGNIAIGTPDTIFVDKIYALRLKAYA